MGTDRKNIIISAILLVLLASWSIGNYTYVVNKLPAESQNSFLPEPPTNNDDDENYRSTKILYLMWNFFMGMLIFIIIGAIINVLLRNEILSQVIAPTVILLLFTLLFYIEVGTSNSITDLGPRNFGKWFEFDGQSLTFQNAAYGLFILTILLTGLLVLVSLNLRRNYGKKSNQEMQEKNSNKENVKESISSTVEKTIKELEKTGDVYSTILNCYIEMVDSMEKTSGILYKDFMTPREFKEIIIERLNVSPEVIEDITDLFEEARYSSHILTEEDRERAKSDLKRFKEDLES